MPDKPLLLETRTIKTEFEVRDADSTAPTIEGYAATFNQAYDLGAFREVVDPSAFTRTLSTQPDVRFLIDHQGQPLARTKSGTLDLLPDSTGLHMRAKSLDMSDPDVQRLIPKVRRKDLDEMSFAFRVPKGGDTWDNDLRTLREINLTGGDVSIVTYPANPNTAGLALRAQDARDAQCVYVQHLFDEIRSGENLSPENVKRLRELLDELTGELVTVPSEPVVAADRKSVV